MVRTLFVFLGGIGVGAGALFLIQGLRANPEQLVIEPRPMAMECERELHKQQARVAELEGVVAKAPVIQELESGTRKAAATTLPSSDALEEPLAAQREGERWKISAIEKFVPLTEEQKTRLAQKFEAERQNSGDVEEASESLEAILGEENAKYYREQVKAAFERVGKEEAEKEVVWLSRQLGLSDDQEQAVRGAFANIEQVIDQEFGAETHGVARTAQDRVGRMIAENRRRLQLRLEQLKNVLSSEQYQAYVRAEAESSAADVEVFHDPGQHQ